MSTTTTAPQSANHEALIQWCQMCERHVLTAMWLVNVSDHQRRDPFIPKPDFTALQVLLIDLKTHAPDECFHLAASLAEQIPPCYATQAERDGYRVLVECLKSGNGVAGELPVLNVFRGETSDE